MRLRDGQLEGGLIIRTKYSPGPIDLDLAELRPELYIFRMAAQELRSSNRFKRILQIIRAIGNKTRPPFVAMLMGPSLTPCSK